jgi:two-component system NtrC family response regulator
MRVTQQVGVFRQLLPESLNLKGVIMEKDKLLIIEDDEDLRTQMKWGLSRDYEVLLAGDRPSGLAIFKKEHPAVVTLDLGLPPKPLEVEEGFLALSEMLEHHPLPKVVVITGQDGKEHALNAVGQGAYDFLSKPIQFEELSVIIQRAFHLSKLEREYRELQKNIGAASPSGMLGSSTGMQEVFAMIRKVAPTDAPVLILGESGTGKELTARAIHQMDLRHDRAFVAINCGAIPENLLESELFGHEKGAFTGAHVDRVGRFELAKGGTLFLDEIGELPALLQVKLLRFLQEQRIERVGGREQIAVDARVIAAANTDLERAMQEGLFREDLYYRLGVVVLSLPPLREREGDIQLLATAILRKYATEYNPKITGFNPQALRAMRRHAWPGNVRELENRVKRAVIMAEGKKLTPADLELSSPFERYNGVGLKAAREALEKDLILRALERSNGNITRAAEDLGISRPTLYEMMERLGLER